MQPRGWVCSCLSSVLGGGGSYLSASTDTSAVPAGGMSASLTGWQSYGSGQAGAEGGECLGEVWEGELCWHKGSLPSDGGWAPGGLPLTAQTGPKGVLKLQVPET